MKKITKKLISVILASMMIFVILPVMTVQALKASDWAAEELNKANEFGLIPASLIDEDLTKPITRAEFAAVAVKLYENLSGKKAAPADTKTFADTQDEEVLKAYNVGITDGVTPAGVTPKKFDPNTLLNREQAATMLTRVVKRVNISDWTLASDANFTLNFTQPPKFKDDAKISDWAKQSVYFMAANKIILGDNNNFKPKNTTAAEESSGYANATREAAIVIAERIVVNLKGKPLDYKTGGGSSAAETSAVILTLEKIRQTAESMGYEVLDHMGYNSGVGVTPSAGLNISFTEDGHSYKTCFSVMEFKNAADAQKYEEYSSQSFLQTKLTKIRVFSYEQFYFQVEDATSDKGKDVLKALLPNSIWDKFAAPVPADPAAKSAIPAQTGTLTADIFKTFDSGTFHMKARIYDDAGDTDLDMYVKNGMTAVKIESEGMSARAVIRDGKSYMIMDDLKMIYMTSLAQTGIPSGTTDTGDLIYTGEGSADFRGKTYKYEEYKTGYGTSVQYFVDNGSLKGMRTITKDDTQDMEILALDKNVPDSVFVIPSDYQTMGG